jgi:outer membrane protein assembly factor BamB
MRAGALAAAAPGFGSDWPVYHHDRLGSGADNTGTQLNPAHHAWTSQTLDGEIYGEPLVEDGRVIVATENNTVYALAADTGGVMWFTHIAAPVPSNHLPCGDIGPTVGITSTPVIDPARSEVFVVDDESTPGGGASHHLVGLDLITGAVMLDRPADPPGSHPLYQLQRPGLALDAGRVIIGFGGNSGDCETAANPYHGWLVALPERAGPMSMFEVASRTTPAGDSAGAIWMGGAAPIVDGAGNIWVATGNSTFTTSSDAGFYDNSDGVLELNAPPNLTVKQFFAPAGWYSDNAADLDLGSSAPALLSDGLVLQAGKSQTAYVISQSALGGVGDQEAPPLHSYCGRNVDGGSAVDGQFVYTPCQAGVVKTQVIPGSSPSKVWQTNTGSGGPPILGEGFVWTIAGNGTLYGLDPMTGDMLQSFSLGSEANHFPTPSIADGLLLAPASNSVVAFAGPDGVPPPPPPDFTLHPGAATDIGVGANGSVWVVGTNPVGGGLGIWHWNGSSWAAVIGGGIAIAVDPAGNPWLVNSAHRIYHWNGKRWILYPGTATDIGAGGNGSVWVVGTNPAGGGFGVWRWNGSGWSAAPGGAVRIAVDAAGHPWIANSTDDIYHWNGTGWNIFGGRSTDIAVGANGSLWVAGTNPVVGGFGIWRYAGAGWSSLPGGAARIAVDTRGNPWIVTSGQQILSI